MLLGGAVFRLTTSGYTRYPNRSSDVMWNGADLVRAAIQLTGSRWIRTWRRESKDPLVVLVKALSTVAAVQRLRRGEAAAVAGRTLSDRNYLHYRLGMALARLGAERHLGVPFMADLENVVAGQSVRFAQDNRKRPDLIGMDLGGNWHVVEAKAHQQVKPGALKAAKFQAKAIKTINGVRPVTWSAAMTELASVPLEVHMVDPEPKDGENLEVDEERMVQQHYEPFMPGSDGIRLLRIDGEGFAVSKYADGPYLVGVRTAVLDRLRRYTSLKRFLGSLEELAWRAPKNDLDDISVGFDGTIVISANYEARRQEDDDEDPPWEMDEPHPKED